MREVAGTAARIILEVLEAAGLPLEPLVARLPVSLVVLREGARIDWDAFAALVETVELVYGDVLSLREIGERALQAPSHQFLRLAGQLALTPRQLYTIACKLVAPAMFSNITLTQKWLPSGQLELVGELAPGYRESEAVFRLCHANVIASPRLLGLPSATVTEQAVTGRRSRLIITMPASRTIGARLRRGVRAVFSLPDAFRTVARHQEELEASLAALRTSRHELRHLIERLPDGALMHRNGIVTWVNASMLELLGLARIEDVIGRYILDFMPPEDRAAIESAMANASPNQVNDQPLEYRIVRADGSLRRVHARGIPNVELDGRQARLVVVRDVTELHRMQEQMAMADRMASLGRLAAGVAHEINNPLAYVHASIEVASRDLEALADPRTAHIVDALARAKDGTQRVRDIVRDLKMLSRADDEPTVPVDLEPLLDSTLALAANAITPKARVIRSFGDVPPARGSRARLGQVFLNLLLNAADAIPDGDPTHNEIRVTTRRDTAGHAVVEITDTGAGIPPALAGLVFEPFFTTKQIGAGTGLGLAICHRIVSQLGGEIGFESTPGKGTSFRVSLPPSEAAPAQLHTPPAQGGRARILVVDDEEMLLRAIEALIGDQHEVVTVTSGREALELLQRDSRFDVIVADLMMADINGMALYEAVRTRHPGYERRFLFMTGGSFTAESRRFLEGISNRCIDKPFDEEDLLRALSEVQNTQ